MIVKSMPKPLYAVVPAYNEAPVIAGVIDALRPFVTAVVVVDDGSADGTALIAREAGASVVKHPYNLGQGAALQTGIDYSLRKGAEHILTFDADGQHDVSDILRLVHALETSGADIALGSRFLGQAIGLGPARRLLLRLAARYSRWESGLSLSDTQNGLRLLTRGAAEKLRIRQNRMAHAAEIITQMAALKLAYVEVPCTVRYTEYSLRKGQRLSGALLILLDLWAKKVFR